MKRCTFFDIYLFDEDVVVVISILPFSDQSTIVNFMFGLQLLPSDRTNINAPKNEVQSTYDKLHQSHSVNDVGL